MKGFNVIVEKARLKGKISAAVVNPVDYVSLSSAIDIAKCGIIDPVLFGSKDKIEQIASENNINIFGYKIVDCQTEEEVLSQSIHSCRIGKCKMLIKGSIHTSHLMKAVFDSNTGLRGDGQLSHLSIMDVPSYHKLMFITDGALNIEPTLEQKESIIINSVDFMRKIGIEKPNVAVLSSVEYPSSKIKSSVEADVLAKNEKLKSICNIEGPLAFDNAISLKAADIKGIKTEIAGDVDLFLVPNLDVGNILFKSLIYLAKADSAGVVIGAKVPIVLTSRSDTVNARLVSAAFCALMV